MKTIRMVSAVIALAAGTAACSTESAKSADTAAVMDTAAPAATAAPVDSGAATNTATMAGGMMDPNTAAATDLATVPGISPDLAAAIVAGRPYADNRGVDEILAKSLTEAQRDSVYTRVWIPLDLNKASGDEIVLIPGVGTRMRREFLEYRPYASIEEFRREIGKYVDKDEVARLERYVKI